MLFLAYKTILSIWFMNVLDDQSKINKSSSQGRQTLFRVTYRTQINLIRIADNKANMIMGINAMIITILIGIISSSMIFTSEGINGELIVIIPVALIMLTALFTAVYAIRAAKPRLLRQRNLKLNNNEKTSLLFFENIWDMPGEEYLEKMKLMLNSSDEIYEHMITDIHNQAKVLHSKYKLLRIAYLIFMVGYVVSIVSFLLLWLIR